MVAPAGGHLLLSHRSQMSLLTGRKSEAGWARGWSMLLSPGRYRPANTRWA